MTVIQNVRVILTAPQDNPLPHTPLVVVKVETSEPGLHGLGCATFTQRYLSVAATIEQHLAPLVIGRDVARIEELWQLMMVNGYWRNGPVLNNAISGIDQALWDIKGKQAGLPVYQLLGGKVREAAAVYRHADGASVREIVDCVGMFAEQGVRHVRVQSGGYGGVGVQQVAPRDAQPGEYFDPRHYMRTALEALETVRGTYPEMELIHDVHERLTPSEAVGFAKAVEPLGLFFLEDALAIEDLDWLDRIRAACVTPIAIGELFNHPREWLPLIVGRKLDFIRMHVSQMGGLTPARKIAVMSEQLGIRTAWHGPADTSPVGHAANLHLELASYNFGIHEFWGFNDAVYEVFPGAPVQRGGYLYTNDRPGWGIDLDEEAAKRWPCESRVVEWTQARRPDGGIARP